MGIGKVMENQTMIKLKSTNNKNEKNSNNKEIVLRNSFKETVLKKQF